MSESTASHRPIPAILLAGGQARRMGGGDKSLRLLAGRQILTRVIDRIRPQVTALVLNANGDPARFEGFGLPVVADDIGGQPGPLAGVLAGLDWAAANMPAADFVLTVSTDCPFLPMDLVARLSAAVRDGTDIALAASNGRTHPVIGLWRAHLRKDLRHALIVDDIRKVERFCDRHRHVAVNFSAAPVDPFFNTNAPEDLAEAERLQAQLTNT
jgi:molybdopterin-guanine dinucleotide biosynthesis protein A